MSQLRKICDGVFKCEESQRPSTITNGDIKLHRFMDYFYIDSAADELDPSQVAEVCRERSLDSRCFNGVNVEVKSIFKKFFSQIKPANLLEVGAGASPIFKVEEALALGINYVTSDADPHYIESTEIFSGTQYQLSYPSAYFDSVAALFVLHFKFYPAQISEIFRCLKDDGLFFANIYRRSHDSRTNLINEFLRVGFCAELIDDPLELCQSHQYLLATKNSRHLTDLRLKLMDFIKLPSNVPCQS